MNYDKNSVSYKTARFDGCGLVADARECEGNREVADRVIRNVLQKDKVAQPIDVQRSCGP